MTFILFNKYCLFNGIEHTLHTEHNNILSLPLSYYIRHIGG